MSRELTYAQAISEAIVQGMEDDPQVFLLGLGVDDFKGLFNTTVKAFKKFGPRRVIGTPASENALTGIAIGAALNRKRPILVHARNDFMFLALDQMLNNAAKWKYAYAGQSSVPFVVRGIIGKGWGQGPTHSQSIQSVFAHFPGLYVAMPSSAYVAKGLLLRSLQLDTPVVLLEHRALYNLKENVPQERYAVDFGKARIIRAGKDVTVVGTSLMVEEAKKAADMLSPRGILLEIIDPVSLNPLDEETILTSVKKTGRLICADTSWLRCGFAGEVAAVVAEKGFSYLKGPIKRIGLPECPCPVSRKLEDEFYPDYRAIIQAVSQLLGKNDIQVLEEKKQTEAFMGPY